MRICTYTPKALAQAKARPGQARILALGPAHDFFKPKPPKARPKPGLSGQARAGTSLLGTCNQPREHWRYVPHHQDCGCRKFDSYLGIRSHTDWQPCSRRFTWCDCHNPYARNQGKNVSIPKIHMSNSQCTFRFRRLDNGSNISRVPSFIVDSLKPWKFLYTAMFDGEWLLTCFTRQTTFAKWVSSFLLFNLVIRHFISLLGYFWHQRTISMVPSLCYAVIIVSWSISCGLHSSWVIKIGSGWLMHATYSG